MIWLILVSLLWAFSFSLIGHVLNGVDANFVALVRLAISLLVFLPLMRTRRLGRRQLLALLGVGALQFGVMYVAYINAYGYLKPAEIALFTVFTPLYCTLINDLLRKRLHVVFLLTTLLAVAGAAVLKWVELDSSGLWMGFGLMQLSNICFAFGQIGYKKIMGDDPKLKNTQVFGLLYMGGAAVAGLWAGATVDWMQVSLTSQQWLTLIYLGAIASGVGFFLWNYGATKVNAGSLAIMNNLKIPLAVGVAVLVVPEKQFDDPLNFVVGGSMILAALALNEWAARKLRRRQASPKASLANESD
ncbi:MAG: EamA family transporter [Phycisphaerae bacterium]